MKGIILAGGSGTRLFPVTLATSKQLLPVYDKPLIYYPLSTLMLLGIRDVMLISSPRDLPRIKDLLGDGSRFGMRLCYREQKEPNGIAEAFLIAADWIQGEEVSLILGDNIFHGSQLFQQIKTDLKNDERGARVIGYRVADPRRYGVVELDSNLKATSIVEKPQDPKSNWAVTGLYFYDSQVVDIAKNLKPSNRGELEITDLNREYLKQGELSVTCCSRGVTWIDAGTPDSLLDAATYVEVLEKRQGLKIACPEEIAVLNGWMEAKKVRSDLAEFSNSDYAKYLMRVLEG